MNDQAFRESQSFRMFAERPSIPDSFPDPTAIPAETRLGIEGEYPKNVGLLLRGIVKKTSSASSMWEQISGLYSKGYWIGLLPFLLGQRSMHSVITLTECSVIIFTVEEFSKLIRTDAGLLTDLLLRQTEQLALAEFRDSQAKIAASRFSK